MVAATASIHQELCRESLKYPETHYNKQNTPQIKSGLLLHAKGRDFRTDVSIRSLSSARTWINKGRVQTLSPNHFAYLGAFWFHIPITHARRWPTRSGQQVQMRRIGYRPGNFMGWSSSKMKIQSGIVRKTLYSWLPQCLVSIFLSSLCGFTQGKLNKKCT